METLVGHQFLEMKKKIAECCQRIGRNPEEVVLVGASKYADADGIREAVEAGLTDIGENRVQDAKKKFPKIADVLEKVTKHMIGHLQTNKVKNAVELFDVIQSVDSIKLVDEIQKHAEKLNKTISVMLQINSLGEESKSGVDAQEANELSEYLIGCPNIQVCGLMTMAPLMAKEYELRACFRKMKVLRDLLNQEYGRTDFYELKYLSMGMSSDYEIALEEGANMLRIGSAIFQSA